MDDLEARAADADHGRPARLDRLLRHAFIEGAREDARRRLGPPLRAEKLERVMRPYRDDLRQPARG